MTNKKTGQLLTVRSKVKILQTYIKENSARQNDAETAVITNLWERCRALVHTNKDLDCINNGGMCVCVVRKLHHVPKLKLSKRIPNFPVIS